MHFSSFFRIPLLQFGQRILARTCLLVLLFLLAYLQAFISCTFAFSFTKFSAQFLLNKQPFLPCPGCAEFIMKVKEISRLATFLKFPIKNIFKGITKKLSIGNKWYKQAKYKKKSFLFMKNLSLNCWFGQFCYSIFFHFHFGG